MVLNRIFTLLVFLIPTLLIGQISNDTISKVNTSTNDNQQYAGLGKAASAIFNSDKRYSISGFGEANFINYQMGNNPSLGDLELYYTNLFRFSTFFGFKITDNIIINSEILIEHLRYKDEYITEFVPELYLDVKFNKNIGIRVGYIPLTIGYINSNDEPVLFHSVNRPEVERVIIPTSWVEVGLTSYGQIVPGLDYFLGVFSTPNAEDFVSPTYIRGGADPRFEFPKSWGINYQLLYTKTKGLQTGISGFYGNTGQGHTIPSGNGVETVKPILSLSSVFARYDFSNVRIIAMATYSTLSNTNQIYKLTNTDNNGQVIGSKVYGYYVEAGVDMLHYFNINRAKHAKFWNLSEMKLPFFVRYERLDTHYRIDDNLQGIDYSDSNLEILALGINFKPNEDLVLKFNYQFRENKNVINSKTESDLIEFGLGFNF